MPAVTIPASSLLHLTQTVSSVLPTGIGPLDSAIDGLPRGGITEIWGLRSSGKTSLMLSTLAEAAARGEYCAVVDTTGCFDPASASRAGVALPNLLWARCNHDAGAALKITDVLLHSGGFGIVCLDLSDVSQRVLNRLPSSYWFRFRLAVESTPTVLLVLSQHPSVRSCAIRAIECRQSGISWTGHEPALLLDGLRTEAVPRRPIRQGVMFAANALQIAGK